MPLEIGDDKVFLREHSLIHARRGSQNASVLQAYGDVAFPGDDEFTFTHPPSRDANLTTMLFIAFYVPGNEQV
jgi:hypothetical protein